MRKTVRPLLAFILLLIAATSLTATAQTKPIAHDITVALDGTGDFQSIQTAINSIRDFGPRQVKIHIKKGIYKEKVAIPSWKTQITLIGEDPDNTIITSGDYSGKPVPCNTDSYGLDKYSTYTSYTLLIQGDNCSVRNLTIRNTAGPVGQAVALHVEGDRCAILNCKILGNQDTIFLTKASSRQYYKDCYIEGTTDFIFGEATALFENCTIKSLANSFITAASTTQRQKYGFVFVHCNLVANRGVTKVYLGRPWRSYAKTVFINTQMGVHILPEGWNPWTGDSMFPEKDKTAYYGEYNSSGKGANPTRRVSWSKQLTKEQADTYTIQNVLGGLDGWEPNLNSNTHS